MNNHWKKKKAGTRVPETLPSDAMDSTNASKAGNGDLPVM